MKEKLQQMWLTVRRYWQRPQKGETVAYKEVAAYSVGAMGVKSYGSLLNYIQMAPTCLLVASVYGLSPTDIMWLFIVTNVVGVIKTPFVSMLQDNTNTPLGKFRPYMLWAGIPCLISTIALTWFIPCSSSVIPFDTASMAPETLRIVKIVLIAIFFNLFSIAQPLLTNAFTAISQVISPNSKERTRVMGISEFLGNLGPSIVQFLLPTLGLIFFGEESLENIWTYRIFMPLFGLAGFLLGLLVMTGSHERVVLPKSYVNKIKFTDGMKILAKNKEFWLMTMTKFFGGFQGVLTTLLPWVCAYQLGNSGLTGIVQTITSVGFTPGIILAPIIISKLGARKGGFIFAMGNAVAALIMFLTFRQGFAFFVISLFIYNFALGPQYIMQTSVMSDGFDAQQLKTDTRIEGFANNFQVMITTIGSIISTVVFTFVYESNGLVADPVTGETDYSILTNAAVREPIISTLILIVIGASVLTAVPYLFVTLDAGKMKGIRAALERRKFITDNALQGASEEEIKKAYGAYLDEKERQEELAAEQARREKSELLKKQEREREENAELERRMREIYDDVCARGGSRREAKRAASRPLKERKARLKAERRAQMNKLKEDMAALRARKKAFCKEWIAAAKAEGKKKWLKVLASEAFSDLLAQEAMAEAENPKTQA